MPFRMDNCCTSMERDVSTNNVKCLLFLSAAFLSHTRIAKNWLCLWSLQQACVSGAVRCTAERQSREASSLHFLTLFAGWTGAVRSIAPLLDSVQRKLKSSSQRAIQCRGAAVPVVQSAAVKTNAPTAFYTGLKSDIEALIPRQVL